MRLKEAKVFSLIIIILTFAWNLYMTLRIGSMNLVQWIVLVSTIAFQLRASLIALYFKRNQLMFHGLSSLSWRVEADCAATMVYAGILPVLLSAWSLKLVNQSANAWLYGIIFILYMLVIGASLILEVQRYEHRTSPDSRVNYRLIGWWQQAWNLNYLLECIISPLFLIMTTGRWWAGLAILLLLLVNFIQLQIPKNIAYVKERHPTQADAILAQKLFIPYLW